MVDENELSIKTLNVQIKVIRVGGNKLTKSVFKQIPFLPFSNEETWENRYKIDVFGYVKLEGEDRIAIVSFNNNLYKTNLINKWTYSENAEINKGKNVLDVAGQIYISI